MKAIIAGLLFVLGMLMLTGESVNGEFFATFLIKSAGVALMGLSAAAFRFWKVGEAKWIKRLLNE